MKKKEKDWKKLRKKRKEKELEKLKAKVPVYYPDWSNKSSVGWSNTDAQGDGWMCVQIGCSNYSSPCTVTVAGKRKFLVSGCSSSYTYSSVFFPVKSGQHLEYYSTSTSSSSSYFIKFKNDKVVLLPDWKNATLKIWNQNYNAECDGWVYADTGSNGTNGILKVNDSFDMFICRQNGGNYSYSSVLVPVSSGDKYYMRHGGYPGVCYFIPGKENHETGMPNWDKEQNKSWNTKYEATEKGWIYAQCRCYYCQNTSTENTAGYLMVNGIPILISKNNSSYYDNASVFIPVAKGDTYNAIGGYAEKVISFFPCIE